MRLTIILLLALTLVGCTSKPAANNTAASKPATEPEIKVDPATAASIFGMVNFSGPVPKPQAIDMSQDPACRGKNVGEAVVVENGKLANVFVYVKDGLPKGRFATSRPATITINQQGCRYEPHVVGVLPGETVQILNSDPTTHNIHPMPRDNKEWNQSQAPGADPITRKFTAPELMIPVQCNAHPWMKMYVNVAPNPFFAVTGADGRFEIKGLPPGTYTVAAVHEKFGEQTTQVVVGPKQAGSAAFTFPSPSKTASAAR